MACVNNIGISPETFMECASSKFQSHTWLTPRKSFTRGGDRGSGAEHLERRSSDVCVMKPPPSGEQKCEDADLEALGGDFEFRLEDNFTMLPADELFLDGKLMPLHLSMVKLASEPPSSRVASPKTGKPLRNEILMDPYLFSPKAPRCTTRWKELLGFRKLYQKEKEKEINTKPNPSAASKSLKNLLTRSSKSSMSSSFDGSVSLPLLRDSEIDHISISSSRLSLSSSSSGHEHDDLPENKPNSVNLPRVSVLNQQRGARVVKPRRSTSSSETPRPSGGVRGSRSAMRRQPDTNAAARGISMDSPRMNASGKIIFQSLERSCSSPSSYGGPRYKHSSVQRSYSANVRVTPVLNVPVCSKSGSVFGLFASSSTTTTQPKRDSFGSVNGSISKNSHHHSQVSKHRKDRN